MIIDVIMPKMGESITEGTILEWYKEVGEAINKDETLLEIGTDKVDSEIPSPCTGTVIEILAKLNDVIDIGEVIAKIETSDISVKLNSVSDLNDLVIDFSKEYILEKFVDLKKEISVIITRFKKDSYEIYEPIENIHQDQILRTSKVPAMIDKKIKNTSEKWAAHISEKLDYIGTMCVEFFVDKKDNLYVNEIAPRVHN